MKVAGFINPRMAHHRENVGAFLEGCRRHGCAVEVVEGDRPVACDVGVVWSYKFEAVKAAAGAEVGRLVYMERSRWRMPGQARISWDDLNGRGDYCNARVPGDRWNRLPYRGLVPWRGGAADGDILVCGHVQRDYTFRHVDLAAWYRDAIASARAIDPTGGDRVVFRPHPVEARGADPKGVRIDRARTAEAAITAARVVVTFSSTIGVDAMIAGVPTVAMDAGSMAADVTPREIVLDPPAPDPAARRRWADGLGYTEWTHDEIRAGLVWEHLRQGAPERCR